MRWISWTAAVAAALGAASCAPASMRQSASCSGHVTIGCSFANSTAGPVQTWDSGRNGMVVGAGHGGAAFYQ